MKICPIAIAVGCAKCPVFKVCPLTAVIGDQPSKSEKPVARSTVSAKPMRAATSAKTAKPATSAKGSRGGRPVASRKKPR